MKNKIQIVTTLILAGFIVWWISFQSVVAKQGSSVNWFENTYGLMALIGAAVGVIAIKKWGGLRTVLGKALLFFTLGLFLQEAGQLISSYYTQVDKVALPYPSWGDAAYFSSVLFYLVAALFLLRVVGAKFSFKKSYIYKFIAIALPIVLLVGSYLFLLHGHKYDTSKPLTVFLDAGYPIVDASYISVALVAFLLSKRLLGGIMKSGILLVLLALFIQYVADFTFIYQNYRTTTYVPGKYDDLFYLLAYFVMTTAMIRFLAIYNVLHAKTLKPTESEG